MLESYAIGISSVVLLAAAWIAVQSAWRRTFSAEAPGPDALQSRGCSGCGCVGVCERREADPNSVRNPVLPSDDEFKQELWI